MTGALDDHVALEAQEVAQRKELLLGSVGGRVLALRRIGKHVARTEHMAMRIHGAGRQLELSACAEPRW